MQAAFTARWQAWVFAVAMLGFLALPSALDAAGRPTLRERLRSVPSTGGDFASIEHVILDEPGDIDVLILGTSYLWAAIDTPFLEQSLANELGRPIVARTIGSNFRGEEMYTLLLAEVLARKKVGALILSMPGPRDRRDEPHPYAHRMAGPEFLAMYEGLPLRQRAAAYGARLLGAPRHALALFRGEITEASPLVPLDGALVRRAGFLGQPFEEHLTDEPPALDAGAVTYGPTSRDRFCFTGDALDQAQLHFTEKTLSLARSHRVRVIVVSVPTWRDHASEGRTEAERWPACVVERMAYPELWPDVSLVGIPGRTLYGAMTEEQATRHYYSGHMNANGARYFTKAILPGIVAIVR